MFVSTGQRRRTMRKGSYRTTSVRKIDLYTPPLLLTLWGFSCSSKRSHKTITAQDVTNLQTTFGLSTNKALAIARHFSLRYKLHRQPYLKKTIQSQNLLFVQHFQLEKVAGCPVVVCSDVNAFLARVELLRHVTSDDRVIARLFLDGGRNKFSVAVSLIRVDEHGCPLPSDDVFLESGVKRLLLIACAYGLSEKYDAVAEIMMMLPIRRKFVVASDLKVANLATGVDVHSCRHPCHLCEWDKNTGDDYDEKIVASRTFEGIRCVLSTLRYFTCD